MTVGRLCVFYEDPFWVGVFERVADGKLSVVKVTFGAEPKEYEVYDFVLQNYHRIPFSPAVETVEKKMAQNPKRIQRAVKKQMLNTGIGTKSQQALKLLQEEKKTERKVVGKERKEAAMQLRFEMKQQRKKEKHRGR